MTYLVHSAVPAMPCCQIDEDIDGTIDFLAQPGPFSVPVRCRKKRCEVGIIVLSVFQVETAYHDR